MLQYPCGKHTDEEQTKSDCGTFSCSLFLVCLHVIFWYTLHAVYLNIYVVSAGQCVRYFVDLLFVHLKATNRCRCIVTIKLCYVQQGLPNCSYGIMPQKQPLRNCLHGATGRYHYILGGKQFIFNIFRL